MSDKRFCGICAMKGHATAEHTSANGNYIVTTSASPGTDYVYVEPIPCANCASLEAEIKVLKRRLAEKSNANQTIKEIQTINQKKSSRGGARVGAGRKRRV